MAYGNADIDDLDLKIMAALREDGRTPTAELARVVSAPETTVRARLNRLRAEGLIRIVAVTSARPLGFQREVFFNVKTEPGSAIQVARSLARLECVRFIAIAIGAFDLFVTTIFRTDTELFEFVTKSLSIEGIVSYQTSDVMAVLKRSFDWLVDQELLPRDGS